MEFGSCHDPTYQGTLFPIKGGGQWKADDFGLVAMQSFIGVHRCNETKSPLDITIIIHSWLMVMMKILTSK